MRITFLIDDLATERPRNTTVRLAMQAANMGHETWLTGINDMAYEGGRVWAMGQRAPHRMYRQPHLYLSALRQAPMERIPIHQMDVLMLRANPTEASPHQRWAWATSVMFGRLAAEAGVLVLNDPEGLSHALNKVYLEYFPQEVRPHTLISRQREVIRAFVEEQNAPVILKPLSGSGGAGVFLVRPGDDANINQMVEAIGRDGYIIAQEYLPAAEQGDVRLFLIDGRPLRHRGKLAAFHRTRAPGDIRNNVSAGGEVAEATITPAMLRVVDLIGPRLRADGMFLVGLDLAGDKIIEINVYSPGGLGNAGRCAGVSFTGEVIRRIEARLASHNP